MTRNPDIPPRGLDRALFGFLAAVALLLFVLAGCSQTRTVTVPAAEPTVTVEVPDTTREAMLPPPEPAGEVTRPQEVVVYEDTATYTADLSLLEVDTRDETVTVRTEVDTQTVERTYQLPAYGEGLRLRPDSGGLSGTVFGAPTSREVEATAVEVPWYQKVQRHLRLLIAFVGGMAFGYVATKLIPGL